MKKQDYSFPHRGFWWRTMGFTKCHLVGVFVTETSLGILAICCLLLGFIAPRDISHALFISAVCLLLVQITVLLSSILALMFYWGASAGANQDPQGKSSQQ